MVNYTVKKALKILEPRRTKERKEDVTFHVIPATKLAIIDPSHELISQKHKQWRIASIPKPYSHSAARHSNPELHIVSSQWASSSAPSAVSFDAASVSSLSACSPTVEDFDEELDLLEYDGRPPNSQSRRLSTGSSRAKSQQKLAKILGWNPATSQRKDSLTSQSVETLVSPSSTSKSPFSQPSLSSWHTDLTDVAASDTPANSQQRRRSSSHRSNSIKSTSSKSEAQPYDYQMRQFISARPYPDNDRTPPRTSLEESASTPRSGSPRSFTHNRGGSNPNLHKPLPTTPSFTPFAPIHPLSQSTLSSNAFPINKDDDEYSPILGLSAEEASVLLSQPEPQELPTEPIADRVELSGIDGVEATANRIRSKSPTQPRTGSAAGANDFGPGHTLSVIEEEPWTTEDLAEFKVFELPANASLSATPNLEGAGCPGLSPSSSLSSRKMRAVESENDANLEDQTEPAGSDATPTQPATASRYTKTRSQATDDSQTGEGEGEEIIVIYDRRVKSQTMDINGRSFLSLDEDTEEEETDTEESVRRSYRSSARNSMQNSVQNSARNSMRGWPLSEGEEKRNRRTSAETTKTAYTTTTERTFVDPDFSGDLAKNLDWL